MTKRLHRAGAARHRTVTGTRFDALVTDVHTRWGLAGVRDLGRAGVDVIALGHQESAAGVWSRHAAASALGPESIADPVGFVQRIVEIAEAHGPLVVYPSGESAIDALGHVPFDLPSSMVLPYAGLDTLPALRDKRRLPELAAQAGLATPQTLMEATASELAASPPALPFAVKQVAARGSLGKKTRIVHTEQHLHDLVDEIPADEPLLVQEVAQGPLTGLALVIDRGGRIAARFQQVARRLWPIEAGGSTLAVSVSPDEGLVRRSTDMLAATGFWGLAQLQFMRTPRGAGLIDVNPRFYGSMPLATASGVNLPATWHAVATGRPVPAPAPYRLGVSYRWLEADLTAAFNGSPRRLIARTPRPKSGAVWARDDPVPGLILGADAIASRVRRRLGRSSIA